MTSKVENGVLTIELSGRIDTSNAAEVEAELLKITGENTFNSLVIDIQEVPYISSAGLRVMLKLRKAYAGMKIINASPEVYDIFDMTGFTEILTVEKAYRVFDVSGCEVIGEGSNGVVYRLDPETIIKVYRDPNSLPDIKKERELAKTAFVLGIPTAIPYDVCRVGDTYGSVFELLNAKSMGKLLAADHSRLDEFVKISTDILKNMHQQTVKNEMIPSMRDVALQWAGYLENHLPHHDYKKLYQLILDVPESDTLLHGDYHIKNLMMQGDEALLIDMDTLCHGNPVFEMGSVFNAYVGFSAYDPTVIEGFMGINAEMGKEFFRKTFEQYFETTDPEVLELQTKRAKLVGYMRLLRRSIKRNVGEEHVEFYKKELIQLIEELDSLAM